MSAVTPLQFLESPRSLTCEIASGDALDVRHFSVHEGLSQLFEVHLVVRTSAHDLDLDAVIGAPARFRVIDGFPGEGRTYDGICRAMEQVGVEDASRGLSTYELTIVPPLWLLTERRNHRMFQGMSEPEIVLGVLREWGIDVDLRLDVGAYKKREYRVQYAESDFAFVSRMLEDAGITYLHETARGRTRLVLTDAPHAAERLPEPLPYENSPSGRLGVPFATEVTLGRRTRPGRYVQRDWDFRVAATAPLYAEAGGGLPQEAALERFHFAPSALHFFEGPGPAFPQGDDRGKYRRDTTVGDVQAKKRLEAKQGEARSLSFRTNALHVAPGAVLTIASHPRGDVSGQPLLVVTMQSEGAATGDWAFECQARYADAPFLPPLVTEKPRVMGIEPATVVGPKGEEIHVDEFGRVRVHFHWDRESALDERSSVWIPVSHAWSGPGYGHIDHPRVGHEVIVDFLCGDPDQPIVVGRIYTAPNPVIYPLVENKTKSGWRSDSSPGGDGFNELMFEDKKARELVRYQAQKDSTSLIKRDAGTVVVRDSQSHVDRDQTHTVMRDQTTRVRCHRSLRVERHMSRWVDKDIYQESLERSTVVRSKRSLIQHSNQMDLLSVAPKRAIMGRPTELPIQAFVQITPDKIVIQAPLVDINPGVPKPPPPPKPDPISQAERRDWYFFGGPEEHHGQRVATPTPTQVNPPAGCCRGGAR